MAPQPFPAVDILSGIPHLARSVADGLRALGIPVEPGAPITIVLDAHRGWAVHELERMQRRRGSAVVVVTWNPCPEHLRELIELDPDVLASGALLGPDLAAALAELAARAGRGERFRLITRAETVLRPHEERVLRLLARGRTKREIAEALHLTVGRIGNLMTEVHQALGLANDREVALYYWGEWQLFEEERRLRLLEPGRGERA